MDRTDRFRNLLAVWNIEDLRSVPVDQGRRKQGVESKCKWKTIEKYIAFDFLTGKKQWSKSNNFHIEAPANGYVREQKHRSNRVVFVVP